MKSIVNQATVIGLILEKQKISTNIQDYRLLNFCVLVSKENKFLLYNNLTRELLSLTEDEFILINSGKSFEDEKLFKYLVENWFLVPKKYDDTMLSNQITAAARSFKNDNSVTEYIILPTTACNARCFYCFEAGVKGKAMTADTALCVANFIKQKSRGKKVKIQWFGGEPLCNMSAIDIITDELNESGIEFISTMVSNGYIFDDDIVNKSIEKWNLKWIQITLDGMQETYNKIKNYVYENDSNPFARVIDNIERLLKVGVLVKVRLNMDNYNYEELFELINFLAEKFNAFDNFEVYSSIIFEEMGTEKISRTTNERLLLHQKYLQLKEHIKKSGVSGKPATLIKEMKPFRCMADNPTSVLISPEGNLGNCEHYIDSNFFGNVFQDAPIKAIDEYVEKAQSCGTCALYPDCFLLKPCSTNNRVCYDYERTSKITALKEKVYNTYIAWREKNED